MIEEIKKVEEFHNAFEIEVLNEPATIDKKKACLRYDLMQEENDEYIEAALKNDLVGVADALGDKLYILCGTILSHGMQHKITEVFNEIHRSNMSKLDENGKSIINGENGIYDDNRPIGKVLKSKNYSKPNLEPILDLEQELVELQK